MSTVLGLLNYWVVVVLMMTGFYIVTSRRNLIKKVIGLNIFQTSVFLLYISIGKVTGGTAPIMTGGASHGEADGGGHGAADAASHAEAAQEAATTLYTNPLPSVLILTAIVVGVATTSVAMALIVRIREAYGTVEEDEIQAMDGVD